MNDMISVVVPAYNCAPWLPRCIDSLLAQTYENLEIIVVDDGSSDETLSVLQSYGSRIRSLSQKNQGVTAARLKGVSLARGQWIGFADADDSMEPWMYARLMENAETCSADISHCGYREIEADGRVHRYKNSGIFRYQDHLTGVQDLLENTLIEPGLWNKLYRKNLFEGLSLKMDFSIRNNEDMLMNYYLFGMAESSVYEDVDPYHYRLQETSASRGELNSHRIYDPIRVRQIIAEDCPSELQQAARESLVWNTLFSYRQLVWSGEKRPQDKVNLRELLRQQRAYLPDLKKKTALQLRLLSICPRFYEMLCRAIK